MRKAADLLLTDGLGLDGAALGGDADHILGQFRHPLTLAAAAQADDIAHMLGVDGLAPGAESQQRLHRLGGQHHILHIAGDHQLAAPVHHRVIAFPQFYL